MSKGTFARPVLILLFAASLFFSGHARAEEIPVPIGLQAELLAKVAAYDKNFAERAGDRAKVVLLLKGGNADSNRAVAQMQTALGRVGPIAGLPHDEIVHKYTDAPALASLCR